MPPLGVASWTAASSKAASSRGCLLDGCLLEGCLLEGCLLEGCLLEAFLLEGCLFEGCLLGGCLLLKACSQLVAQSAPRRLLPTGCAKWSQKCSQLVAQSAGCHVQSSLQYAARTGQAAKAGMKSTNIYFSINCRRFIIPLGSPHAPPLHTSQIRALFVEICERKLIRKLTRPTSRLVRWSCGQAWPNFHVV